MIKKNFYIAKVIVYLIIIILSISLFAISKELYNCENSFWYDTSMALSTGFFASGLFALIMDILNQMNANHKKKRDRENNLSTIPEDIGNIAIKIVDCFGDIYDDSTKSLYFCLKRSLENMSIGFNKSASSNFDFSQGKNEFLDKIKYCFNLYERDVNQINENKANIVFFDILTLDEICHLNNPKDSLIRIIHPKNVPNITNIDPLNWSEFADLFAKAFKSAYSIPEIKKELDKTIKIKNGIVQLNPEKKKR